MSVSIRLPRDEDGQYQRVEVTWLAWQNHGYSEQRADILLSVDEDGRLNISVNDGDNTVSMNVRARE